MGVVRVVIGVRTVVVLRGAVGGVVGGVVGSRNATSDGRIVCRGHDIW